MPKTPIKITTQDVIDYLKKNPSFFKDNDEMLQNLDIGNEGVTPFHDRQIKALQERENQQQTTIDSIVDSAKNNQRLESDLLKIAIHLLGSRHDEKDATETVGMLVKRQFNVHNVVVLLDDETGICRHARYDDVRRRVAHLSSICDDRVSSDLLEALFNEHFKTIKSCAFVPMIFADEIKGVMVLGSSSEARFQAGIGVVFLDRLGLLVGGYLQGNK